MCEEKVAFVSCSDFLAGDQRVVQGFPAVVPFGADEGEAECHVFYAPISDQTIPDCLQRWAITVLQLASTTPEPGKRP